MKTARTSATTVIGGLAAVLLAVALVAPASAYPRPGRTERVSVNSSGVEADADIPFFATPAISGDGRFVAFMSPATNLVPGDTNGKGDVFVRDRVAGTTERVSVSSAGTQANGGSGLPSITPDGRYVAFQSSAPNLVAGATGTQFFLHDRQAGTTELVSVADDGTPANDLSYASYGPQVSADGRYVVFSSKATNLAANDTNGDDFDVFLRDRAARTTLRVSSPPDGTAGELGSLFAIISADGRSVAFTSLATNLVAGDTNRGYDILVWDRVTHGIERASVPSDESEANNASAGVPAISADGRFVAFQSYATNLVPADANGSSDIFVRDRVAGTTERVTVSSTGAEASTSIFQPYHAQLSADGRHVAFGSISSNLVAGDTNGAYDTFVHDRATRTTERVSVTSTGAQSSGLYAPAISADGRHVAFYSASALMVPNDTNGAQDVFVRDRGPEAGAGGLQASLGTDTVSVSGWGTFSGAIIASSDDAAGDAGAAGGAAGAEITRAEVAYRPEPGDLLVRVRLASLPGNRAPSTGGAHATACLAAGCPPGVTGLPGVLYGFELTAGGVRHEIRVLRAGVTSPAPAAPSFGLYRCAPGCAHVATLSGGYGTTGEEVFAAVPLSALGVAEGAALTGLRAFAAAGEAAPGGVAAVDDVTLPGTTIPARSVSLGVAPAGTPEAEVAFDTPALLADGSFDGDIGFPGPGGFEVWARACLGSACGTASTPITID